MPAKYFRCPDGQTCPIDVCLDKCVRPNEGRCLSLPTLKAIAEIKLHGIDKKRGK